MYIPDAVKEAIHAHVTAAVGQARDGFMSAAEDEDTLTGHLGALLQTSRRRVEVPPPDEIAGEWRWTIRYTKFRGRGPRATERYLGADGIFELCLEIGGRVERKSLLFQSKIGDRGGRALVQQALMLSTWREAATVLTYAPIGFSAYALDDVLASGGDLRRAPRAALDDYLAGSFLGCRVGDDELRYDATRRQLRWRAMSGELVATDFQVAHRVSVGIEAPTRVRAARVDKQVRPGQIHDYRMAATEAEILQRAGAAAPSVPAAARRDLLRLYHPDRFGDLDELARQVATRRSQDISEAYARVTSKARR